MIYRSSNQALTSQGWAKLLRALQVSDNNSTFPKYATKGKMPFEGFLLGVAELDRVQNGNLQRR
jgi:hypothetical protein